MLLNLMHVGLAGSGFLRVVVGLYHLIYAVFAPDFQYSVL